jgi:hypothetical protein
MRRSPAYQPGIWKHEQDLPDQAALHGVLARIAHLCLMLVSVSSLPTDALAGQRDDQLGLAIESGEERRLDGRSGCA